MPQYSSLKNGSKLQSRLGNILKFIIPLVVSVGLCVVMFRDIDFGEMMRVIESDCDFRWIGLMLAIGFMPIVLRALRWGIQLRASGIQAPTHILIYSIAGTYAVNIVFPRLGEVWRTGYVAYRQGSRFSTVFGSMIADRFADLVTVGLITLVTFLVAGGQLIAFVKAYPHAYTAILHTVASPWTWLVAALAIAATWRVLTRSHNRHVLKVKTFISGLWQGFAAIARMKGKSKWLALTAGIWICYFTSLLVAFHAFPMTERMLTEHGTVLPLVCFVLTSISMGIPSNGGIGPYQTALMFGLMLFLPEGAGTAGFKTVGAAFGNIIIASQTLMFIVLGIITFTLIAIDKKRGNAKNCGSEPTVQ